MSAVTLEFLAIVAAILVTMTALLLLAIADWRFCILLLAIQYCGVFILVATHWSISMAVIKLVAGWIAGAVLGMAMHDTPVVSQNLSLNKGINRHITAPRNWLPAPISFYALAAVVISILLSLAFISRTAEIFLWFPGLSIATAWGALVLIGMGLIRLAFTSQPFQLILGLLTAFSGFEVVYAQIEDSTLVALLLAGISLGLAMAGVYLLLAPTMQEDE